MSLHTAVVACCQDSFILLFNLIFGVNFSSNFNYFLIFFLYFLLFTFVDFRIILFIWRYQNQRTLVELSEAQVRKHVYCFQIKFYLIIFFYNYFMWKYFLEPVFILINGLVLLPQVFHNTNVPVAVDFDWNFFVFFSALKYLIFYYFRGCPVNIMMLRNFYGFPSAGFVCLLLSLVVICLQGEIGPRFFVPRCLSRQYNYFVDRKKYDRLLQQRNANSNEPYDETCPVCLMGLTDPTPQNTPGEELKSKVFIRLNRGNKDNIMVAPCKHSFHTVCLLTWMQIKMECPACRAPLPQVV